MYAKTIFSAIIIFVLMAGALTAQPPHQKHKPKRSLKEILNLTPEEAGAFKPVFNDYKEKYKALRKEYVQLMISVKDTLKQLPAEQQMRYADEYIIFRQRELDLRKEFHANLKEILPPHKILLLYRFDLRNH